MNTPMKEMPKYKSHKEVWALKIKQVIVHAHPNPNYDDAKFIASDDFKGGHLIFENEGFAPIPFDAEWYRKHQPEKGGYYVVYPDGYKSWSPAEAFESGYKLLQPMKVNTEGFVGRPLYDHKNNKFNRECIEVVTADLRASDNAHHAYEIFVYEEGKNDGQSKDGIKVVHSCSIKFQNGGLKEVGPNGITDQALLAIVLDRLRSFNEGQFRCRENSMMITKIEEALMWGEKRANDRAKRGVEGERKQ